MIIEETRDKVQDIRTKAQEVSAKIEGGSYQPSAPKPAAVSQPVTGGVKGGLSKIRQKISDQHNLNTNQPKPIDPEQLAIAWQEFILKLKTAMKHSVVSTFEMMECRMKSPEIFEIVCYGNIQLGFLKQEKTPLLEHMIHFFHNPAINIHVELIEAPEENNPADRPLSTKEQFMRMAEKYPLVKELRDKLNMELDY